MDEGKTPFAGWVVLEMMGHQRAVGFCTEVDIFGTKRRRRRPCGPNWTNWRAIWHRGNASCWRGRCLSRRTRLTSMGSRTKATAPIRVTCSEVRP
jgi:hypothetical protein